MSLFKLKMSNIFQTLLHLIFCFIYFLQGTDLYHKLENNYNYSAFSIFSMNL